VPTFKWDDSLRAAWVQVLTRHTGVLEHFNSMSAEADGIHTHNMFCQGLSVALTALNKMHDGRVQPSKGKPKRNNQLCVHKPWFDYECKSMHKQMKQAERWHGAESAEALLARKAYLAHVQSAKRRFDSLRLVEMMQQFTTDPRSFWKSFQNDGAKVMGPDDMAKWTEYFRGLFEAIGKSDYVGGCVETHSRHFADLYGIPSREATQAARVLNAPFEPAEVKKVLSCLANHKASGVDGVPAEFYKNAFYYDEDGRKVNVLVPYLVCLFNAVLKGGYPPEWAVAALVPVPKPKADHSSCDGFRGIAVGPALGKIYSMLLLQRMDAWAEKQGLRAAGQAGFRAGRSTVDNIFVLKHIICKYKAEKKPVYAVFVDFKKAYDSVDRELLWRCLEQLGVHGELMQSLRDMHADVQMKVRLKGCLGEAFKAERGVRQGDPLSPLLFGLLIDRFEAFLAARHSEEGVRLGSSLLRLLLYADDLVLLAETRLQAQAMLNTLSDFCAATCMTVNVAKSEVVVFNTNSSASTCTLLYNGQAMPIKPSFVYLGITLDALEGLGPVLTARLTKAKAAMHGMFRRCYELGIHNVGMQCRLFDTLVQPVLNYGCEVWGADFLRRAAAVQGKGEAEMLHFNFLRQSLGVRKSTTNAVMLRECNRCHVNVAWLKQALGFYNRVIKRMADDVTKHAVKEDINGDAKGSWANCIIKCLRTIGCEEEVRSFMAGLPINVPKVVKALCDAQEKVAWQAVPVDCPSVRQVPDSERNGFKCVTYLNWFAAEKDQVGGYIECLNQRDDIVSCARFCMGSHSLGIETGRWNMNGQARRDRSQRVCTFCRSGERDDEMHVLHCGAYAHFRLMCFGNVDCFRKVTTDADMRRLMTEGNSRFWHNFAKYLQGINLYRKEEINEQNSF
jgi:sorting nexin-29